MPSAYGMHFVMRLPLLCCACDCADATASAEHVLAGFGQADDAACEAHCAALCAGGTFTRFCRTCYRFLGLLC